MKNLSYLRGRHGAETFLTILPDGNEVPWRPLAIGDYIKIQEALTAGQYPRVVIEDEVFRKCVTNQALVSKIGELKAGTVSTVFETILAYSGPQESEELNFALAYSRDKMQHVLHQMVMVICTAFSGYKPEDVYSMDYETLMLRLAQSEFKLMQQGIMQEPIAFGNPEQETNPAMQQPPKMPPEKIREAWNQQHAPQAPQQKPKVSPVKKPQSDQTVITAKEAREHDFAYTGHEMEDKILLEHEMVEKTSPVYKDYLEQMARGEKVKIKSVEERLAEAKKRMAENERKYKEAMKIKSKQNQKLSELIAASKKK